MKRFLTFVILVILAVFTLFLWNRTRPVRDTFTPATATPRLDIKEVEVLAALDSAYTHLVESVTPSVVSLTTSRTVQARPNPFDFFFGPRGGNRSAPQSFIQNSLGSGVIVSREGHIITNNHVVANFDEVKVHLRDGRDFPATIIGTDEANDIAVLKINATGLEPLPLGDSDQVKVGSLVLAVGNPFGLQETVTRGIVSATGRQIADDSATEFIQTDTAINPGNSGGPLVNLRGEIIAINTAIGNYSGSGTWQGVGFAIPANIVRRSMEAIISGGRVVQGYLGVTILGDQRDQETAGALINAVAPGSPAEKAGLKAGDRVIAFNERLIKTGRDLIRRVGSTQVGATVKLKVVRDGEEKELSAVIEERPAGYQFGRPQPQMIPPQGGQQGPGGQGGNRQQPGGGAGAIAEASPLYGIETTEIPAEYRDSLPANVRGVMITSISPDAPVAGALEPGDVIEEIGNRFIDTPEEFERIAQSFGPNQRAILSIVRGKTRSYIVVEP